MPVENPKELFTMLLSNVRAGAENATTIFQMLSQAAENPEIKEALSARAFISNKVLNTIDECFKLIGATPTKPTSKLHEVFVEDFRREFNEIKSPEARHLYLLAKAHHLNNIRMGEYVFLIEAADLTGHYGVGLLLASCLADKVAFTERTKLLIRNIVASKIASKAGM